MNLLRAVTRMFQPGPSSRRTVLITVFLAGLTALSSTARASVIFDWPSSPAWTTGQPTINGPDQTVDYSSTGQNISVTLSNTGATWNSGYPQVVAGGTGSFNGGTTNNGLILQPIAQTSNATYIKLTLNFNDPAGVTNVAFQIWDVDATVDGSGNGFIDSITHLQAAALGGGTLYPTTIDNTHTSNPGTTYNFITGSGASLAITGDPSQPSGAANNTDQGTINITFAQPITQISFWYANVAGGSLTTQTIGIGPLTYDPLPEVSPAWSFPLVCATISILDLRRRRRQRRTPAT